MLPATIGPFQVQRELGRGGMGEVYLATDTRLDRQVAIKALPADLAADPDRLARFQREAKVLASLNHPGIGAIYGFEVADGRQYLILEFVEGITLADRLARGAIPVDEALTLAKQIAEALEVAHEKGVIHRDLKPGNVMVTPEGIVKVLDFGLARTDEGSPSSAALGRPDSPTVTSPAPAHSPTIPGAIMGTAGYMSPEQARGKPVDKRSDIFSFGCVLYEMLTGTGPFPGETVTDSLGAILHREPDWTLLPPGVPPGIRDLLKFCLAKDRSQRLHDIADARLLLVRSTQHAHAEGPKRTRVGQRERVAWAFGLSALAAATGLWLLRPREVPSGDKHVLCINIPAPPGNPISVEATDTAISPDGRHVAFIAGPSGKLHLWVRDLDSPVSRMLEGTDGASMPFWSPDNRSIGYFADGGLCRIGLSGGSVVRLADAPSGRGGTWSEAGQILFAPQIGGPLYLVSAAGGPSKPATKLAEGTERGHRFPQFLPGGRRFLYSSIKPRAEHPEGEETLLGSLDSKEVRTVCVAEGRATYAPNGWLMFVRGGLLNAQAFDLQSMATSGEPIVTAIRPDGQGSFAGYFNVTSSNTGTVASPLDGVQNLRCVECNGAGEIVRTLSPLPAKYLSLECSSSAGLLAVTDFRLGTAQELRLIDAVHNTDRRLVEDPFVHACRWSVDGKWLYYTADRASREVFRIDPSGPGVAERVFETGDPFGEVCAASANGRSIIYSTAAGQRGRDLWVYDTVSTQSRELAAGPKNEYDASLSPDGTLVAIASDESGEAQLYLQEFPEAKARVRVSNAEIYGSSFYAAVLRWSSDGSKLFFLDRDGRTIRSAAISKQPTLTAAEPHQVMMLPEGLSYYPSIGPDGKSAFALAPAEGQAPCSILVTLNCVPDFGARTDR